MSKLGPHVIRATAPALAWAARAGIVKAMDTVAPLQAAGPEAVRVFRHYFPSQDCLADSRAVADAILGALGGYRHPRLYVEVYNEVPAGLTPDYAALLLGVVPRLHAAGVRVAGPCWSTGDYKEEHWQLLRSIDWCGLDAVAVHCYWATMGLTGWNALRYRQCWQPGDPPVLITECGRDRIRDGLNGEYVGAGGWQADGVSAETYLAELRAYDRELGRDAFVLGGTVFTAGPTTDWERYSTDGLDTSGFAAAVTPGGGGSSVSGPDYPNAVWRPVPSYGYPTGTRGRGGHLPVGVCEHITAGAAAGVYGWFADPKNGASSHYLVRRDGGVEQYVAEADAAWAQGQTQRPDLANPFIADAVRTGTNQNLIWVSVEHEAAAGEGLTEAQYQSTLALHRYLFGRYKWPAEAARLVRHSQIDAVNRPNDPGPAYPMARLLADLARPASPAPPALNWSEVAVYGQWSLARVANREDPRDLSAFDRHLAALKCAPDRRRYGCPG